MASPLYNSLYAPVGQHWLVQAGFARCDGSLGPFANICRNGRFDFTLLFEEYFLALLPSVFFIIVSVIRLTQLWGAKPKTFPSSIIYLKLGACVTLCASQIIVLVKWARTEQHVPAKDAVIAESALSILSTLVLSLLTHQEQRRSIAPSTLITVYLLVSILFDAVRCRTVWLLGNVNIVGAYFAIALATKFVILCLENQNKRSILIEDWHSYGREATSGLLSRSMLFWVNNFLLKGHRSSLTAGDMYALSSNLRSQLLLHRVSLRWEAYKGSGKRALLWSTLSACRGIIMLGAIPRIGLSACKISEPFLVTRVITFIQQQGAEDGDPDEVGYALIVAVALLSLLRPVASSCYDQAKIHMKAAARGSLISTVLHHATLLEPDAKEGSSTLTLITTDTSRVLNLMDDIHELWIIPIEIGVAAWLLARQVGAGAIGPGITFIVAGIFSAVSGTFMGTAQKRWSESVKHRVNATTTVLRSMKETKLLGLVDSWRSRITVLMENQIKGSLLFRKLIILINVAGNLPDQLAPIFTFGIAILIGKGNLDIATAFTSLNIMKLVLGPLANLNATAALAFSSLAAAERLQDFVEISEAHRYANSQMSDYRDEDETATTTLFPNNALLAAQEATIRVKSREDPILANVNFSISRGSFTIIAGKVGSGKSVLIRALLGHTPSEGSILRQVSNVAYCAQSTWLVNATAKENILGQSEWDAGWYKSVVSACALDQDFEQLPDGDSVLVGSKGQSLSGGQKQRISLARAIYSRKKLVIIDDLLSGLDWATQRHVWTKVFSSNGLLRQHDTTLVLATHALHLVESPDSVILLGYPEPGKAIQGTLKDLKKQSNIDELISSGKQGDTEATSSTKPGSSSSPVKADGAKDTEEEKDLLRKTGDLSLYKYYFDAVGWSNVAQLFFAGCIFSAFVILPDVWLMMWGEANMRPSTVNTAFYYGVYTLLGISSLVSTVYTLWTVILLIGPVGLRKIHARLLDTVMTAPLAFFVGTDTGDLINRFTRDVEQVDLELPISFLTLTLYVFTSLSSIGLVVVGSPFMVIIVIPLFAFMYVLQAFYLRTSRQLRYLDLHATAPLYNHFIETVDGAATIQAFGWEVAFSSKGLNLLDECQKPYMTLKVVQVWLEVVLSLFVGGVTVLLIVVCVLLPSSTSGGAIALAFTHVLQLGGLLAALVSSWTMLETSLGSTERIRSFENNTPKEIEPQTPQILESNWPAQGRVELNSLSASYSKPDGSSFQALNNVQAAIQPGQKVGICGRTGSGKSTLLLTLFRLVGLDAGSVVIDGVDISNIPHDILRSRLIVVPQEPTLFPGTLRSNLAPVNFPKEFPPEQLDQHLVDCLEKVDLWQFVHAQGGLDIPVDDIGFSQGQKQLVCLARALAQKDTSKILVLDEAMSAVDQKTEELMVKILEEQFSDHTIISVVHRLNTIREFDTVLLLDRGQVVEAGAPSDLLEREGGRFHALWNGNNS